MKHVTRLPSCSKLSGRSPSTLVPCCALALLLLLLLTGSRADATCSLSLPTPPDPLPPGFDWTALATAWCDDLAACGLDTSGCVTGFIAEATNPTTEAANPPPDSSLLSSADDVFELECFASEEYLAGTLACSEGPPVAVPLSIRWLPWLLVFSGMIALGARRRVLPIVRGSARP